ncbi:MAG: N-acyl-D-amino-acid deacylase family protein [Candidatus Limnocylindrales bacterium]
MSDNPDLVITGGTIVDGTGAPGRDGTVIVEADRMRLLPVDAPVPDHVGRRLDATGRVVAPGFIDLHSHGGLVILAEPRHEPKVRQGVTTEIVGVDGNGFAPFERQEDLDAFVEMDSGLDGRPDIDYDWRTVADYLARFDGTVSVNVGTLVGNSALRIAALGWDDEPADDRAIDTMQAILRDAMADGAVGLSSGLDYPPGSYATTDELAALTRTAGEAGGFYHTHVRYQLGDRYLDPFKEAIEIGRRAGGPTHLTHFYHRRTHPGGPEALLQLVDGARAQGLDVTFDTYPSEWASTRLLIQLPGWIQAGGPAPLKARLADRTARDRLRHEIGSTPSSAVDWADVRLGAFRRPDLLRWESHTLTEVMAETGRDAVDVLCDLLLAEDLGINQVTSGPWADTLRPFVVHPVGMVGTDSTFIGAKPSPRTYGSYPRILGQFVRDEGLMTLEEAVRKMTGAAAARLGLKQRGTIRDGAFADIVVFDPSTIRNNATYDEPRQFPTGIGHVIVNGTLVVDGGEHTGATPGRGIRLGDD